MKYRCAFILPYFGRFPGYFPLFLKSCGRNPSYRWIILTDCDSVYDHPDNVTVIHMEFGQLRQKIQQKFEFPIALDYPYKLCDFKPVYGLVFEEYLSGCQYWGHCDCDLIFGNLERMLTPLLDSGYDKLFAAGHLTIYRNTPENNRRFLKPYRGTLYYKKVFSNQEIMWYDEDYKEENIHSAFREDGARIFDEDMCFSIAVDRSQFYRASYSGQAARFQMQPFRRALYVWNEGEVERTVLEPGKGFVTDTFLYMHFQMRRMRFRRGLEKEGVIQIYPNGFRSMRRYPVAFLSWKRLTRYSVNLHYFYRKRSNLTRRLEHWKQKGKRA